jgi:hypothetical protein
VRLAGAQHAMGTVLLPLGDTERDSAFGEVRIAIGQGRLSGYVSGRGRWAAATMTRGPRSESAMSSEA